MPATAQKQFQLSQQERNFIKRRPGRVAFIAVVNFSGPRGRAYRPIRTAPQMTTELAARQITDIRGRRYANNAMPTSHTVYRVDFLGYVQEEVV